MFKDSPFYNRHLRTIVVAFGALFSNIVIQREKKDGTRDVAQTVNVPIEFSNKDKWLTRIEKDPTLEHQVYTILPRMAYEITDVYYDPERKLNKFNKINCRDENGGKQVAAPTPYNMDISLYVLSKTDEDAWQIIEQILPFFNPELTVKVKNGVGMNITDNIPVVIKSITFDDDYEGDFYTRRSVIWTITFSLKLNFYQGVKNGKQIKEVIISLPEQKGEINVSQETPTSPIIEIITYE